MKMIESLDENTIWNGVDRAAHAELFGYALYAGEVVDGSFRGFHQGFVGESDEAEAWVRGEDVSSRIVKLYAKP